jgi:H3 lysine-79-specific histone-lysine N-methyltransferase
LKDFQQATALKDGLHFLQALSRINDVFHALVVPVPSPSHSSSVLPHVIDECYVRAVQRHTSVLKKYEAASDGVYGEMLPSLIKEIIEESGLGAGSIFLDLGSGVGNVVTQVSLSTGCLSYGIENAKHVAEVAEGLLAQTRMQAHMWGLEIGQVEIKEGDMLKSSQVRDLVKQADVVFINNKALTPLCMSNRSQLFPG